MIDPRGMSFREWADQMILDLSTLGPIPAFLGREDDDSWRDWGELLLAIPSVTNAGAPLPRDFETWQQWACQLVETVTL